MNGGQFAAITAVVALSVLLAFLAVVLVVGVN